MSVSRTRLTAFFVTAVLILACGVIYLGRRAAQSNAEQETAAAAEATAQRLDPAAVQDEPHVVFRNTALGPSYGKVALVPVSDPSGSRAIVDTSCERVYAVAQRGFCLSASRGVVTTYQGNVLGPDLTQIRTVTITGGPSRARVSESGERAASTVFVAGHSYLDTGFSTVTEIADTTTGQGLGNLETYRIDMNGSEYSNVDVNFWGVTFASDNAFYATLGTGGKTYLIRGDVSKQEVTVLRENAECPSLSPDGRKIGYKKASGSAASRTWRFTVLDLATGVETQLPETRSIDDQLAWLDDEHVLYGVPRSDTGGIDVWVSPLTGGQPRLLIPDAESPAVVQP